LGPRGTEALLGMLASLGFLVRRQGRFHLTDAARAFLLPDSPYYYGPLLRLTRERPASHAAMRDALRGEKPHLQDELGGLMDAWAGGDIAFSNVFHDWDRASCRHLAGRSLEALPPGGRIYVHEMLLNDTKDGPLPAACFSMSMAISTRGKQYSAEELAHLLTEAGFTNVAVTPTYAYYSLVSAEKPA
jgi:hypothetical protein